MKERKKVLAAMSAGVDSSVVAALLREAGYEVTGIAMRISQKAPAIENAKKVARLLKFRHIVVDLRNALEKFVIQDFCLNYLSGKTPNPCIICNQYLKFGYLFNKAKTLGADFLRPGIIAGFGVGKTIFTSARRRI